MDVFAFDFPVALVVFQFNVNLLVIVELILLLEETPFAQLAQLLFSAAHL